MIKFFNKFKTSRSKLDIILENIQALKKLTEKTRDIEDNSEKKTQILEDMCSKD
jgi:hypothetical protein